MNVVEEKKFLVTKSLDGILAMNLVKILAARNFSSDQDLGEIRQDYGHREVCFPPRILARFLARLCLPGILVHRQWDYVHLECHFQTGIPTGILPGLWPPGILFPPRIPPGYLPGFPPGGMIPAAIIPPGPHRIPSRSQLFFLQGLSFVPFC